MPFLTWFLCLMSSCAGSCIHGSPSTCRELKQGTWQQGLWACCSTHPQVPINVRLRVVGQAMCSRVLKQVMCIF